MNRRIFDPGLAGIFGLGGGSTGLIKSVQFTTGQVLTGSTTLDKTITSVNTSNSIIIVTFLENQTIQDKIRPHATFTSSTNVRLTKGASAGTAPTAYLTVVEFNSGAWKSIQKGSITVSGSPTGTATITSVDTTKSIIIGSGFTNTGTGTTANLDANWTFDNGTTPRVTFANVDNHVAQFQVLESY